MQTVENMGHIQEDSLWTTSILNDRGSLAFFKEKLKTDNEMYRKIFIFHCPKLYRVNVNILY